MATFFVRVELHGAKHGDKSYAILHAEMKDRGFKRTLKFKGVERKLPTAEYLLVTKKNKKGVFDLADEAAAATGLISAILVIISGGTYSRLEAAQ